MDYDDRGLAAMPKLVGGPKYSRPPVTGVPQTERPVDPDDLPLVSAWTEEDHAIAKELGLEAHVTAGSAGTAASSTAAVATASPDTAGHAASHPNGSWSASSGSSSSASSSKRGFGGIFRGRSGRSGAS